MRLDWRGASSTALAGQRSAAIAMQMVLLGGGLFDHGAGFTEAIIGSLSADKAGVGSAVNDTTRELGGTLGVAVVGGVFASVYSSRLAGDSVIAARSSSSHHDGAVDGGGCMSSVGFCPTGWPMSALP